jgi:hypothetical protein
MTNVLSPGNNPRTHEIGEWVGPREGLTLFGKDQNLLPLPRIEPRYLCCPARRLDTILYENKLSAIMNIRRLQFSQEQAFGTSPETDEPNSHPHMLFSCC